MAAYQLVLILPDGNKSLIPAEWTDFKGVAPAPDSAQLVGSLDDLLRLRGLVDAFLRRKRRRASWIWCRGEPCLS
jgi:hypothetical protein